ncbi:hypothetical protein SAMN04487950_3191 [Halogranum rubrum]|uniref:Uncharacterized protein n=1 Tax=Halogranum rubrum TaxID=553466 RepID=A0A1I4GC60_9EURY|nr:hypothetical protein [Halogranum rubrum]SFL27648.1 hypothetical protein SAMN04487950_3191 [Halogranum rubrum]
MSRRVPEFALVIGGFLALTVLATGVAFTGDVARSVLTAAIVGTPFGVYAVHHSDDPTTVLPPQLVLAGAAVLGGLLLVAAVPGSTERLPRRLLYALFVALVVGLPLATYAVRYGDLRPLPPRPTAAGSALVGLALLVVGPLVGDAVLGAVDAVLVFLAGNGYADAHGVGPTRRVRRALVVAGGLLCVGLVALGIVVGSTTTLFPWVVAGIAAALAPSLHYALSIEREGR